MKYLSTLAVFLFILVFLTSSFAQFDIIEKVKKKVEKKAGDKVDDAIDEATKEKKNENQKDSGPNESTDTNENNSSIDNGEELKVWSKYNFVPGDKIIFSDDLAGEENGEFPSRWDLISGNAENAILRNEAVINFAQPNSSITPLLGKEEYLPEVFTLEFDAYFHDLASKRQQRYLIQFWTRPNTRVRYQGNRLIDPIIIDWNSARMHTYSGQVEGVTSKLRNNWSGQWKHIALSFNKRSLKVFLDESRLLNIPNLGYKPTVFSIVAYYDQKYIDISAIKNIRLAEGGKDLYDRVVSEGRFVTRGILFDVNKSNIRAESMGVINEVVKMMNEHGNLNFRIEGHTDSDGDNSFNQKLSEERAEAVKNTLVSFGISESRLTTKGFGESVPVDNNSTPEGKANNRRVEFVKI